MKALGMIEVYGYLTAVEALDSALKAANVNLLDVVCVQGGLVAVFVLGDVGAVKASIDAASSAAERVGKVISVHVIARPAQEIETMLKQDLQARIPSAKPDSIRIESQLEAPAPAEVAIVPEVEPVGKAEVSAQEHVETEIEEEAPISIEQKTQWSEEEMLHMTVSQLRAIVRQLDGHTMTRKEIRFAKKEQLIAEILKICGQEG